MSLCAVPIRISFYAPFKLFFIPCAAARRNKYTIHLRCGAYWTIWKKRANILGACTQMEILYSLGGVRYSPYRRAVKSPFVWNTAEDHRLRHLIVCTSLYMFKQGIFFTQRNRTRREYTLMKLPAREVYRISPRRVD